MQADPSKPVLVAGDPERAHIQQVEEDGGITYHPNQAKSSVSISFLLFFPLGISLTVHIKKLLRFSLQLPQR